MSLIILSIFIYLIFGIGLAKLEAELNYRTRFRFFLMLVWPITLILAAFGL